LILKFINLILFKNYQLEFESRRKKNQSGQTPTFLENTVNKDSIIGSRFKDSDNIKENYGFSNSLNSNNSIGKNMYQGGISGIGNNFSSSHNSNSNKFPGFQVENNGPSVFGKDNSRRNKNFLENK